MIDAMILVKNQQNNNIKKENQRKNQKNFWISIDKQPLLLYNLG